MRDHSIHVSREAYISVRELCDEKKLIMNKFVSDLILRGVEARRGDRNEKLNTDTAKLKRM